ncbi:MAG: T9SS type A sorting domain-containing protein [Bacteroidetes bacterium]|nr:T9SS type A sorting domain-containing protein [Bacteroidota bacterium]
MTLTASAASGCTAAVSTMEITINAAATASAGVDATICETAAYTLPGTATNYASYLWTTNGTGTFSNTPTTLTPVYTPSTADITAGSVILTLNVTGNAPCINTSDAMTLSITPQSVVDAGPDVTICETAGSYTIAGATARHAVSYLWTTSGTGTFASATVLNPVYTPSEADTTAGTVTLTLTATSASPCVSSTDAMVLNIKHQAIVRAGTDATICETGTYTLGTSTAVYTNSIVWTTSGTGTFSNFETLHPIYTPGAADITAGTVTLTLTGTSASPCINSVDAMTLIIHRQPIVNAGVNVTICATTAPSYVLTGSASMYQTSLLWTSSGTGTFTDATILHAIYNPSLADITAGTVTLTLTAGAASGCTSAVSSMVLTIKTPATANIGVANATICETMDYSLSLAIVTNNSSLLWTTSGTGTFNNPEIIHPVYTPGEADINAGSVILTLTSYGNLPCGNATSTMTLNINKAPLANAGSNATVCQGTAYTVSGATASNYLTYGWTENGPGSLTNASTLTPTYTPLAGETGIVTLTLTANPKTGCLTAAVSTMTITIKGSATANAGSDATICQTTASYTLSGTATNYASYLWTTSGTGTFSNTPTTLTPVYTPSTADITAGSVILTLNVTGNAPCSNVSDAMTLTIKRQAVVNAGADATICETAGTYTIAGATAQHAVTYLWTTSGTGSFASATVLNPVYTPGAADITAGTVTLTLTATSASPCVSSTDAMVLNIKRQAIVSAGTDATICATGTYLLSTSTAVYSTSLIWTTSGTGTFSNFETLHPIYTPSTADITAGTVTLTLTGTSASPCISSTDAMVLTIHGQPVAYAGSDATICQGTAFTVSTASAGSYTTLLWTATGAGSLTGETTLTPTYTPTALQTGAVTLTLTASAASGCTAAVSTMEIMINGSATANAGSDATICQATVSYTLSGTATNYASYLWTTSGTGTFSNTATTLTPVYTPSTADITAGSVILTLNVTGNAPCINTSDAMTLSITPQSTVDAGPDATICETAGIYAIAGATAQHAVSYLWTTSGTGTFASATVLNPVYTPSAADTTAGTVTLTLTATSASPCVSSTDAMVLNIKHQAIVRAGTDATICETGTYTLGTSTAVYTTSLVWTTSGTGTFSNFATLHPVYTPGAADIAAGTVTLMLTGQSASPCVSSTDAMVLSIVPIPVANAGQDATICETSTSFICNATASNYTSFYWETTGTGSFSNNYILNPVYIPSQADVDAGCIYLVLHLMGNSSCQEVTDTMRLCISRIPLANAGPDDMICKGTEYVLSGTTAMYYGNIIWMTSGNGVFDNSNILHPVYTPSIEDINAGSVVLTMNLIANSPCQNASDAMVLHFYPNPVATAFVVSNVKCNGFSDGILSVNVTNGTPAYTYLWSDGQTTATAIGLAAGTYTVTVTDSHGCKETAVATVGINPLPVLVITNPAAVCTPNTVDLSDPTITNGSTLYGAALSYWMDAGATIPMIAYNSAGMGVYYIKATTFPGCYDIKPVTVTVNPLPVAAAGSNRAICLNQTTQLGAAPVPGNIYHWTSIPAGFTSTTANPYVTPLGTTTYTVTETITATGCTNTHSVVVTVNPLPLATAGTDRTICLSEGTTIGAAAVAGNTYSWTSVPAGFISAVANPTVYPLTSTIYYLTETVTATGCTNSHSVHVLVNPKPVLVITNPAAVCSPNKVNLSDPSVTAGSSLEGGLLTYWLDAAALIPMVNYTSASAGTYYIKATTASGCYDIKPVKVTVNPLPTIYAGIGSGYYCPGGPGLVLGINGSQIGVNYTLWKGIVCMSSIIPGTGGQIFFGPQTAVGSYYVIAENATTHCINTMDNCVEILLQPQLPVSVSIVPSANPISTGTAVIFTATPVNGGSAPLYQWKVNGVNAGSNTAINTYRYYPANGDVVTCVLTSNASCVSGNPASSNAVMMDVTGVPVAVTVTGEVLNLQTNCYNATQTLTIAGNGTSFTVYSGGSATMIAGQNIRYLPGTSVRAGGYMHGYITTNNQYCGQAPAIVNVVAGEEENSISSEQTYFMIYPNPTNANFTLEQKGEQAYEKVKVEVYGMRGERLMNQYLVGEKKHEFWFSDLPPGLYFVKVYANDHVETFKLVKTR